MAKRQHQPDPLQKDLFKGLQFTHMREVSFFRTPAQKLMWIVLALMSGTWRKVRIPMETLAARSSLHSASSGYRVATELRDDYGVIRYTPAPRNSGLNPEFEILWGQVFALHDEWKQSHEVQPEADPVESELALEEAVSIPASKSSFTAHKNSILADSKSSPAHGSSILAGSNHIRNCSQSAFESASTSSPESEAVMVLVKNAGVGQFGPTVQTALAQGMTCDQIAAVVDHFQSFPDRWTHGILIERLTRVGAHLMAADEGWYGDEAWQTAQQLATESQTQAVTTAMATVARDAAQAERETLQRMHGGTLAALSREQLLDLAATDPDSRSAERLRRAITNGFAAAVEVDLLQLLARRESPHA